MSEKKNYLAKGQAMPEIKIHVTGWCYGEDNERVEIDRECTGYGLVAFAYADGKINGSVVGATNRLDEIGIINALIETWGPERYRMAHAMANAMHTAKNPESDQNIAGAIVDMLKKQMEKHGCCGKDEDAAGVSEADA